MNCGHREDYERLYFPEMATILSPVTCSVLLHKWSLFLMLLNL